MNGSPTFCQGFSTVSGMGHTRIRKIFVLELSKKSNLKMIVIVRSLLFSRYLQQDAQW